MIRIIKHFILVLLVLFLCGAVVLLAFEIYLRARGEFTAAQFLIGESSWNEDMKIGKNLIPSGDIGLQWELRPQEIPNGYGRFEKARQSKPENVFRIIAIGDSITQAGFYERFLEERLKALNSRYSFEVWNCGTSGYDIGNYYHYLKKKALKFKPDLIILGFCLNDFGSPDITLFTGKKYYSYRNSFTATDFYYNQYLFLHSNLYRFILFHLEKIKLNRTDINNILNHKLDGIINICSANKIRLIGLVWPYLKDSYSESEKICYHYIIKTLAAKKIAYVDLHDVLVDRGDPGLRMDPDDYIHPSRKAFGIMVEKGIYPFMYAYLKKQGLL